MEAYLSASHMWLFFGYTVVSLLSEGNVVSVMKSLSMVSQQSSWPPVMGMKCTTSVSFIGRRMETLSLQELVEEVAQFAGGL